MLFRSHPCILRRLHSLHRQCSPLCLMFPALQKAPAQESSDRRDRPRYGPLRCLHPVQCSDRRFGTDGPPGYPTFYICYRFPYDEKQRPQPLLNDFSTCSYSRSSDFPPCKTSYMQTGRMSGTRRSRLFSCFSSYLSYSVS